MKKLFIFTLLVFSFVNVWADNCDIADNDYTLADGSTYNGTISGYCNVTIGNNARVQNGGIQADGYVLIGSNATISGDIVAGGDVTVGASSIIQNSSITSGGSVVLEDGARVDQNITAEGSVTIGTNARVQNGNITAGEDVTLEEGSVVNNDITAEGNITISAGTVQNGDVYAKGDITLEDGASIPNGTVIAEGIVYFSGNVSIGNGSVCGQSGVDASEIDEDSNVDADKVYVGENCDQEWDGSSPHVPPDFSEIIEELEICSGVFPDALQSHSTSANSGTKSGELYIQNNSSVSLADSTDPYLTFIGAFNVSNDSCGDDITCLQNESSSDALSLVELNEDIGVESDFDVDEGETIVIGGSSGRTGLLYNEITIEPGGTLIFTERPGEVYEIDRFLVKPGGTVQFPPGEYALYDADFWYDQGNIDNDYDFPPNIITTGNGTAYIFTVSGSRQNDRMYFEAAVPEQDTSDLILVIDSGYSDIKVYDNYPMYASIYASGRLYIKGGGDFYGAISADSIEVKGRTEIHEISCGSSTDPDTYTFTFDGTQTQALTCEPHSVDIQVRNNGAIDTGYNNTVTISTSSGLGDWTVGSANGTLDNGTSGDGNATYQFVDSDNGEIELYLSHSSAGDVSVTVSNADATAEQALIFSSAVLKTELSCVDESLGACINTANLPFTMTMTAVKEDDQTSECVNYNPTEINFWSEYITPSVPTGLAVEVEGNQIGTAESAATPLAISFTDGVASVSVNYPDAGQIIVHAQDASSSDIEGEGETIVNPLQLLIEDISASNGTSNPETTDSGDGFMRASVADYNSLSVDTFELTVTGIKDCSNDTQSHCSGSYGQVTPSFASEVTLETSLVFPSSGVLGNLQYDGDDGFQVDLTSGQFTYQDLAYDEVGSLGVTATTVDGYLLSGNEITTSEVQSVGRFYPDYLALDSFNVTPGCNDDFTYIGQTAIEVNYNIKAYAQGDLTITENYDASLGYPVAGSELLSDQSDSFSDQVYDQTPLSLTDRLLPEDYYDNSLWSAGQYNVIAQEMGIAKTTTPDGPYLSDDNSLDYFIKLSGLDGEKVQTDSTSTCSDDSCYLGSLGDLVYGRLQAGNGHGSEYQAIRTNVNATYYDGSQFSGFIRDICTTLDISQISSDPSKNSSDQITITDSISGGTGQTTLSVLNSPLIEGNSQLNFTAPSSRGSLTYYIEIDSVVPWLLDSGNAVQCPDDSSGITDCIDGYVEFGLFRGNDRVIYRLQTYD